jgi:hypothetical protein
LNACEKKKLLGDQVYNEARMQGLFLLFNLCRFPKYLGQNHFQSFS